MKKSFIAVLVLAFILVACPKGPVPIITNIEYCQPAEIHLKELGCIPIDKPYTVKGKQFNEFCQETMQNGINLNPKCLSTITSCTQMNACVQQ
jgi:hypothetical protein